MNVKQLKEELENYPDDLIVRFQYDNGDYWHHTIAHEVNYIDVLPVEENTYVDDYVVNDNEKGDFIEDSAMALVLS